MVAVCKYVSMGVDDDDDGTEVAMTAAQVSLESCLQVSEVCLHRHNKHLAETHDALARCQVMLGTSALLSSCCCCCGSPVALLFSSTDVSYPGLGSLLPPPGCPRDPVL